MTDLDGTQDGSDLLNASKKLWIPWWRGGVIYNAYPRSWCDTNGDGIGDLRGVIHRLDYLQWLGVDGLWLNPIKPTLKAPPTMARSSIERRP